MAYKVVAAADVARDLDAIFDFLFDAALSFGEDPQTALDRASARIQAIESAMEDLAKAPFQGTLRPELGAGLRSVTKGRAIFYFDLAEEEELLRVLAVFFGGQDHQRKMLLRLLSAQSARER
ncbi:type II toxin-antitoxin system RelE/ParE family toxin [Leisingera sp.]|uniref:type II toxin-antitoxin system RelE/ParE family toxin n=1 Tax=Leisingera sp. TaxID=1879318 RepID=UPI003A937C6B